MALSMMIKGSIQQKKIWTEKIKMKLVRVLMEE